VNGLQLILGSLAIFLLTCVGIVFTFTRAIHFFASSRNPARPLAQRRAHAAFALLFGLGILACTSAGYMGIVTLSFHAQTRGPGQG
jgi:hypothetical protein